MVKHRKSTKLAKPVKTVIKPDPKIQEFSDLIRDCDSGKITHMGVSESTYPDLLRSLEREGNRQKKVSTEKLNLLVHEKKGIPIFTTHMAFTPGLVYGYDFKGRNPVLVGLYKVTV